MPLYTIICRPNVAVDEEKTRSSTQFRQGKTCCIYFVSVEQLCVLALCSSQLLAGNAKRMRIEPGFLGQFIFFLLFASNHVHSSMMARIKKDHAP
jgi:hypothetical protein